jgi:hypothetical protein
MGLWCCTSSVAGAGNVAGLFPPQERDWGLPVEADLSPKAAARIAREAATQSFDNAARALNIDWGTSFDGKQIQRWGEALGRTLLERRKKELEAFANGRGAACKDNEHELLVIGMDGGRVQTREKDEETGSRWKEDKVLTITSCLKGDGQEKPPKKLLTTCMATMQDAIKFGRLARLEAEKRGIRQAVEVIGIHDGGNWIDPLWEEHFGCHVRILDYYHGAEHLHEVARAAHPAQEKAADRLADELVSLLWEGKVERLLGRLREFSARAGEPLESDPPSHPRKVLSTNLGYFEKHQDHMNYPWYRARGWPIGSGMTESGVKLFGRRVKGTEQFWNVAGAEAILALRSKWLSEDEESQHYWLGWPPQAAAA